MVENPASKARSWQSVTCFSSRWGIFPPVGGLLTPETPKKLGYAQVYESSTDVTAVDEWNEFPREAP